MGIFSDSGECEECGRTYTTSLFEEGAHGWGGWCSKRCYERSWAAGMDFYDVDDPDNPAYSNPTYSDSSSSSPVEDKKSEEPSILQYVLSILSLIYIFALVKYNFFS